MNSSLPGRDRFGDVAWKKPTVSAILSILKNPAYAGAFVYGKTRTTRSPSGQISQKRLPMDEWRICVKDKYPAYISWETFEKIQAMLKDNYAAYDRNKSRGIPRPGVALLHGLVHCGECGHKMVVQYKGASQYICNYLHQQYGVSVCQTIPTPPVDTFVVAAFFQALSPVELDAYAHAVTVQQEATQRVDHAQQQQLERLRYQAALAQRQFNRVDPDNRLVAAELEKRWEAALSELKQAEEAEALRQQNPAPLVPLPPELQAAFTAIGQKLPQVWAQLPRQTQKALLRCLIDKVVVHRATRDCLQVRIVWVGGDTTTQAIPIPVGAFDELSGAAEMEKIIIDRSRQGKSDADIAEQLTNLGHRSPMDPHKVLPNTVKIIRLKHGIFQKRSQSHPRHIEGYLTVPQIAKALDFSPSWAYDRIRNGRIQIVKDANTGLYLFPDDPATLEAFKALKAGKLDNLRFS